MSGNDGTCGFCGYGDGRLGEQGDEYSQRLHSSVRTGDAPNWSYGTHPNAYGTYSQQVVWCGHCFGGLAHKYQRLDDLNLGAKLHVWQLWKELDGIRWHAGWEAESDALDVGRGGDKFDPERDEEAGRLASRRLKDDPATHLDKLSRDRAIEEMRIEQIRRWNGVGGFIDRLREEGWRD